MGVKMRKQIIAAPGMPPSAVLSPATRFGDLVFVSGRTGRNPSSGQYEPDIKAQTRHTLEGIKAILEAAGTSMDQVLSNTCYLTSSEHFAGFNEVYLEYFPEDRPARTTVEAGLMAAGALVEVTAVACIPS